MVEDLIKRLRERATVASVLGEHANAALFADSADLIEQQAARIAELEAAIRKQANAARCLADATIRDASIRQGLAEKAYAESSPEVLASERQANAMLTEENERLTARLTALESERDHLIATQAACDGGSCEHDGCQRKDLTGYRETAAKWVSEFHAMKKRIYDLESERDALLAAAGKEAVPVAWMRSTDITELTDSEPETSGWIPLYTAPTAALEKGDGRDAWQPIDTAPKDGTEVLLYLGNPWSKTEKARWYAPWSNWQVGAIPSDPVREEYFGIGKSVPTHWMPLPAPPAALSQKAGEQQ